MKVLIIEDEPAAAAKLETMLHKLVPEAQIVQHLDSVAGAVRWFKKNPAPDLIFLDIQLGDGLSFEIFSQVQVESFVIFTTAYDEYSLKAFELNSLEYLLKPIQFARLESALQKFRKFGHLQQFSSLESLIARMILQPKQYKQRFMVNVGDKIRSIAISQVAYFYSLDKGSFLCTTDGLHLPIEQSLDTLTEQLDPSSFFRINRQYLIAFQGIGKLHAMPKGRVAISLQPPATEYQWVSAARTADFRRWLDM